MTLTQIRDYAIDKPQVFFFQMVTSISVASPNQKTGPVLIGWSKAPENVRISLLGGSPFDIITLLTRAGDDRDVTALRATLAVHHIARGWYAPSPEVMDYATGRVWLPEGIGAGELTAGLMSADEKARRATAGRHRMRPGFKRLTDEQAVEVFRLYHDGRMRAVEIARAFGVSQPSVGRVARGASHGHLFKREWIDGQRGARGHWLVSVASDPAGARYAVTDGRGRPGGR